jgi:hypothetical protein
MARLTPIISPWMCSRCSNRRAMSPVGTFDTCGHMVAMSVHRGRPKGTDRHPNRREWVESRCPDKTSRLHPRHVVPKLAQAYEPEVPVEMREWIGRTLASPDLAFDAQPPAQPHGGVIVDRSIGFANTADAEVALASA